jgi:hypothetical protein
MTHSTPPSKHFLIHPIGYAAVMDPPTQPAIPKNQSESLAFVKTCTRLPPGKVATTRLRAPILWGLDELNRYRYWYAYIGIMAEGTSTPDLSRLHAITEKYLARGALPNGYQGCYWSEFGLDGQEPYEVRAITWPKALGYTQAGKPKSNYTTTLTQAIADVASEWRDKIRKGMREDKSALLGVSQQITFAGLCTRSISGTAPWRLFAMSLHPYVKYAAKMSWPAYVQPKYDGILLIVVAHPRLPKRRLAEYGLDGTPIKQFLGNIDCYSRHREFYAGQEHIMAALYPLYRDRRYHGVHFVGEIWTKGHELQDISGNVRRALDSSRGAATRHQFHIFDCFTVEAPDMGYEERYAIIQGAALDLDTCNPDQPWVRFVPTDLVDEPAEMLRMDVQFRADGLEGTIIRAPEGLYEFGLDHERRSYGTLKLKPRHDEEWPIVGYTTGSVGKAVGQIIFICAESDKYVMQRTGTLMPLPDRKTFRATPNIPEDVSRALYRAVSRDDIFNHIVRGQLAVISYDALSKDFIPLRLKFLRFHDPQLLDRLLAGL